jgi:hypothetical protein
MRKLIMTTTVLVSTAMGGIAVHHAAPTISAVPHPGVAARCPAARHVPFRAATLGRASGVYAAARGELIRNGDRTAIVDAGGEGAVVRHVAARRGVGLAYVLDRRGGDTLVAVTDDEVLRIASDREILHPAWSPTGDLAWSIGTALRVREVVSGRIRSIRPPLPGSRTYSPVFLGTRRLAVVAEVTPHGFGAEGTQRDNLFVTDVGGGRWRPLTRFRSHGDRWVAIRTPVVSPGGAIEFVRVTADASETVAPRFQLWRVGRTGRPALVRTLPGEMYLAGRSSAGRLWNVPDPMGGTARIVREGTKGCALPVGCGSVATDPTDVVDPDRRAVRGSLVPPRANWPDLGATEDADPTVAEIALLVGDFGDQGQAEAAASRIRSAYPGAVVQVVDSFAAPQAIGPGAWGAMLRIPAAADPATALTELRSRLPEYGATSWVVTP